MDTDGRLSIVFVLAVIFFAVAAAIRAAPVDLLYQHPGPDGSLPYEEIEVCRLGACLPYPSPCEPGQVCGLTAQLPPGLHEVWIVARSRGLLSGESNRVTFDAPGLDPCDWDIDGDGIVAGTDFGYFIANFGVWYTGEDFELFAAAVGADCR